jgi:phosphoesterase RecJ-like protein
VISVQCENAEVDKLKYSLEDDLLNIVITPKRGVFHPENISSKKAVENYDLIIVLDSGDLEHLGTFYEENTEMFFKTPVVNIDHHVSNTGFGQINFVDVTAASTTHILYKILKLLEPDFKENLSSEMATLFLTGLIVDTGSFQHTNTSPSALELAADLIEAGAMQQEIIQNVYKTKQLSTLKLWGRILAKIEEDSVHKLVWSTITKEDLLETGAEAEDAEGLIDELMTNAPGAEIVALLKDSKSEGVLSASLRSTSVAVDTLPVAQHFGGGGHRQASGFKQHGDNFNLFVADVVSFMRSYQKQRLDLTDEEIAYQRKLLQEKRVKYLDIKKEKVEELPSVQKEKIDIVSEITPKKQVTHSPKKQPVTNKTPERKSVQANSAQAKTELVSAKEQKTVRQKTETVKEVKTPVVENKPIKADAKTLPPKSKVVNKIKKAGDLSPKKEANKPVANQAAQEQKTAVSVNKTKDNSKNRASSPEYKRQETPKKQDFNKAKLEPKRNPEPKQVKAAQELQNQVQTQTSPQPQTSAVPAKKEEKTAPAQKAEVSKNAQVNEGQTKAEATPAQAEITKEQAASYAQYYAQLLNGMDVNSPEYAQNYQCYAYYAQLAA